MNTDKEDIKFSIDLLLHRKKLNDKDVNDWLDVSENQELIKRVASINQTLNKKNFSAEKEIEFKRLKNMIKTRSFHLKRWWGVAASLLILLSLSLYLLIPGNRGADRCHLFVQEPGRTAAELILANGVTISLSGENDVNTELRDIALIDETTGGLHYIPKEKYGSEIYHILRVPLGGFYWIALEDGTVVWINAGSELKYPVTFSGEERRVELKGEAYFEVTPDKDRPFIVSIDDAHVTVLGTSFNINSYGDYNQMAVTLVEGSISLSSDKIGKEIVLKPGEQGIINAETGELSVKEVDTLIYTSWKDGIFYFKEMTLGEIMLILSRWYQVEISFYDTALQYEKYSGKIPMHSNIENLLRKIEMSDAARFVVEDDMITIYRK